MTHQNVKIAKKYFMTLQRRHDVHAGFFDGRLMLIAFVLQKLQILPQNSQFVPFLPILGKNIQFFDALSAINFHQVAVATCLTPL